MAHILIVEDEAHIAQMIEATLSLGGYTSEICSDGEKAGSPSKMCEKTAAATGVYYPECHDLISKFLGGK